MFLSSNTMSILHTSQQQDKTLLISGLDRRTALCKNTAGHIFMSVCPSCASERLSSTAQRVPAFVCKESQSSTEYQTSRNTFFTSWQRVCSIQFADSARTKHSKRFAAAQQIR